MKKVKLIGALTSVIMAGKRNRKEDMMDNDAALLMENAHAQ
ncbi:MAG: hypothetical protein ABR497_02665 [Kiritimatiellia bacterium]